MSLCQHLKRMSSFWKNKTMLRPGKQVIQLKRLVETRWASRRTSIVAVRKNTEPSWLCLMQLLHLLTMIELFKPREFYVAFSVFSFLYVVIFDYLFGITKGLSDALQSPHLDLEAAV